MTSTIKTPNNYAVGGRIEDLLRNGCAVIQNTVTGFNFFLPIIRNRNTGVSSIITPV